MTRISHESDHYTREIFSHYSHDNGVHVEVERSQYDDTALMQILCAYDWNSPIILIHVSKDALELKQIFERHHVGKCNEIC